MQQATARKTVNLAASFSWALENKGNAIISGGEMILIGQSFAV